MNVAASHKSKWLFLFDVDYTLVEGVGGHIYAFEVALERVFGLKFDISKFDYLGKTDLQILTEVLKLNGFEDTLIESKMPELIDNVVSTFMEVIDVFPIRILPGVKELLDELKRHNVYLGLVTGNLEPIARGKLGKVGLNEYFEFGGFGNDGIKRVDLVKKAIIRANRKYGFISKDNIYVFGDTPRDIEAGRDAGVKTVGVATGKYSVKILKDAGANYAFPNFNNTNEIVEILLRK
ncbi:MAG: HAD hydrolase-like protein [Nitrososphaeria archaeon]|nr:HAD hydrolase-like protein [Nitrososphaeria archaeon]